MEKTNDSITDTEKSRNGSPTSLLPKGIQDLKIGRGRSVSVYSRADSSRLSSNSIELQGLLSRFSSLDS